MPAIQEHVEQIVFNAPPANDTFKDVAVSAPIIPLPLDGIPVLRYGLHLGRLKGRVFLPDHALALACNARQTLPIDEATACLYLHGEVLSTCESLQGWCAPTLAGIQLGFGKATQGQLKNHYPKGLRK